MNRSIINNIAKQAKEHPLEFSDDFESIEQYCLFLMHSRAYEEAAVRSKGLAVLDLGCNNGYGTSLIANSAASVIGCDVSKSALTDACKRFPELDFRLIDGISLPFDDNQFDLVTSFQVIEHVVDVSAYLSEIKRVLKKGCAVLFTTPNASIRLDPGMKPWNRFHVREYRACEFAEDLKSAFAHIEIRGLFAVEELYQVEYLRCQKALEFSRNPPQPHPHPIGLKQKLAMLVKMVLPAVLVDILREMKNGTEAVVEKKRLDQALQNRFSTTDLYYSLTDLDRCLDFMAICTTESR